jgi:hypothetical protein
MSANNDSSKNDENQEEYQTGRWHPSEHSRFIKGCLLHGNNWKKVIKYISFKFKSPSLLLL